MTKAELIRKIVKRSGIPDSEAKVFFEIFLQKTSGMLRPGQAIKLKNFGYFQLRLAVFKTTASKPSGKINHINTEVIVFSPDDDNQAEGLIFNIPTVVTAKYNYIDSYFSLSTGKPIIPLQGVKDTDYFLMPTGYELKKLIESKVDKLLEDVEIIKDYVKDNEILFLQKNSFKDEQGGQSNWSLGESANGMLNEAVGNDAPIISRESGDKVNYENVTWDFGEDLSRQIEEESIIDESAEPAESQVNREPEIKSSLEWEFGEQTISEEPPLVEEEKSGPDASSILPQEDTSSDFQRVNAITSEFNFDESNTSTTARENNLSWDFGADDVKPNNADAPYENEISNRSDEQASENTIDTISDSAGEQSNINSEEKISEVIPEPVEEVKPIVLPKSIHNKTTTREYSFSNKKSFVPFVIAMFTIIVVSVTVFMYINKISLYDFSTGKFLKAPTQTSAAITPVYIERNFDIPVTYPYPKNPNLKVSTADSSINVALKSKNNAPVKTTPLKNRTAVVPTVPKLPAVANKNIKSQPALNNKTSQLNEPVHKIQDNISQVGNNYIVQVSAWRAKSKANNEAAKYKAKGLTTYVEQADVPGRGTWFRVKVGNFKSMADAQKFSVKNK
jgi:nucleoid DNA-binding protein/cell division septation protein DedD